MNNLNGAFYFDQPVPGNEIRVLLNGRIDNRSELSAAFARAGMPPAEQAEDFVLQAYKLWGFFFAAHLSGDFAVAIWDGSRKQLILARDPLGVKPLYYFRDSRKILFASRTASLFENPSVPKKPCASMLGQLFVGEYLDHESTFFEGVRQVAPAHLLIFTADGKTEKKRFWSLDTHHLRHYRDKNHYLEEFYALFENSVRNRIKGTSPGLLLSGGLDSVQICAVAETLRRKKADLPALKSLCLFVEGFLQEDKINLDKLRERYQPDMEILEHPTGPQSFFELFMDAGDNPRFDAFMTTPRLLKNLRARGCDTLLTGFGANELSNLMEFGWLEDLLLSFRFGKFSRECERFAACLHHPARDVRRMMMLETLREKTPRFVRQIIRQRRMRNRKWLRPEFRKKISVEPPPRLRPFGELARNETWHALFEPQVPLGLAEMADAAARYGMEVRHPFLDLPLIEFFLSIPTAIKMEGGYRKNFIQRALAPVMPVPVKTEDNESLFIPFPAEPGRTQLELSRLQSYLKDSGGLLYEYADYSGLQRMLDPTAGALDFPLLWRLARVESWLRAHWGKPDAMRHPEAIFAEGPALTL